MQAGGLLAGAEDATQPQRSSRHVRKEKLVSVLFASYYLLRNAHISVLMSPQEILNWIFFSFFPINIRNIVLG